MKIVLRLLMAFAVLALCGTLILYAIGNNHGESVAITLPAEGEKDDLIESGRYLALAGNCASCHTPRGGEFMAGGVAFDTPFGRLYSTNITPDDATGIGGWTFEEFRNSMRHGVRPDGEHLYPAFPYTAYTLVNDVDLYALYVYLRSVPPVQQVAPANQLAFPASQRALLPVWKALFFARGTYQPDDAQSDHWNRGAYLVEALAHCSVCHSPRNFLGAVRANASMHGGAYNDSVPGGMTRRWFAPDLTASDKGLGPWPHAELVDYLKSGLNTYVETFGPMNEVIINSTRHLTDSDVDAMATYIKSLAAAPEAPQKTASLQTLGMGRTVYNLHCGTCHLPTGLGDEEMAPRIGGGSLVVRAEDPASLINVILYGPELPDPPLDTKRLEPMGDYQYLLDDEEIAALASYIRSQWGNDAGAVSPAQVARQR